MTIRTATAVIDRQALLHNYQTIKAKAPHSQILAVLKANGYGHGLERIAKALSSSDIQADAFGVARLDEALALRAAGIVKPIVLLEGFFNADDIDILSVNNLQTIVHNQQQLNAILAAKLTQPLKVWLKIDTGMHRLGIDTQDFEHFYRVLLESDNVENELVFMSHLACADDVENPMTAQQLAVFSKVTEQLSPTQAKSMANSAGICAWPASHFDWIRPGVMLYGVSPMANESAEQLNIKPVMTLQSSLIAIRNIKAGESVGYSSSWTCQQDTTIGVVAVGYGDGYPRHAVNGTPVLVNGRIVPLVGRVSMDMITVDLGADANDDIGDVVTLWGQGLPVEDVANYASTIAYELLCNIKSRVKILLK